LVVSLR